jgi:hypothetical protein
VDDAEFSVAMADAAERVERGCAVAAKYMKKAPAEDREALADIPEAVNDMLEAIDEYARG